MVTDWLWPWKTPTNYGWYHLIWLGILIIVSFVLCYVGRKHNDKTIDKVILVLGNILLIIEIYKQIFMYKDNGRYDWFYFPFQFCSVPMYIGLVVPLIKNEKIKDIFYKYLATFGLVCGLSVMAYPSNCFNTEYVTILLHTMIWHCSLVWMGVYLMTAKRYANNIKNMLKDLLPTIICFIGLVIIVVIINTLAYKLYFGTELNINDDTFNLFYLSKYYDTIFPILTDIKEVAPYPVFVVAFIAAAILGMFIVWSFVCLIRKIVKKTI